MRANPPRAFTLVELLSSIAIIAILAATALVYIPNYLNWSKRTANATTLQTLNSALQEYKTLGGMSKAHSLQGENSQAKIDAVVGALKTGFTIGGAKRGFANLQTTIDTTKLYVAGSGKTFAFAGYGEGGGLVGE